MMQPYFNELVHCRARLAGAETPYRNLLLVAVALIAAFAACGDRGDKGSVPAKGASASVAASPSSIGTASILLFGGTGTSRGDVAALESILTDDHLKYSTVNSSELNQMSESQIRQYRLLIVPGGNFIEMGKSMTADTTANIRSAVKNGLSYLGICAGGFLAGDSVYYNGLNLTFGVKFGFYSAENQGIRKASVAITSAGAPTLDQYWEDGPQFSGWGTVVGKYPDGSPAIVQGTFGSGWLILSGVHPEAPESWRRDMTFTTPANVDNAYAGTLIHAALNREPLSHY
jgi:glutamine amidotransferase-like uncharacterized protein